MLPPWMIPKKPEYKEVGIPLYLPLPLPPKPPRPEPKRDREPGYGEVDHVVDYEVNYYL